MIYLSRIFRLVLLVLVLMVLGGTLAFAEQNGEVNAGGQQEMFEKAYIELKQANDTLDNMCEKILNKYKDDKEFVVKFNNAQTAWAAFRNAELDAIFPAQDKRGYGSIYPLAYAQEKTRLTLERAKQINQWLTGVPEGTLGAGSRGYTKVDK